MLSRWRFRRGLAGSYGLGSLYLVNYRLCATPKALVYLYSPNIAPAYSGDNARLHGEIQTTSINFQATANLFGHWNSIFI